MGKNASGMWLPERMYPEKEASPCKIIIWSPSSCTDGLVSFELGMLVRNLDGIGKICATCRMQWPTLWKCERSMIRNMATIHTRLVRRMCAKKEHTGYEGRRRTSRRLEGGGGRQRNSTVEGDVNMRILRLACNRNNTRYGRKEDRDF